MIQALDPTHFTALQSLDFGDILSPDGRAHPVTAFTPLSFASAISATPDAQSVPVPASGVGGSQSNTTTAATPVVTNVSFSAADALRLLGLLPNATGTTGTIGPRLVVGVIAIGLILIAAWHFSS